MTKRRLLALLLATSAACSSRQSGTGAGGTSAGSGGATGTGGATTGSGGTAPGSGGATTGSGGAVSSGGTPPGSGGASAGGKPGSGGAAPGSGGASAGGAAGGKPGVGGATSSGGAGGTKPPGDGSNSVLERNRTPSREGHFVQPTLTKANAAKMALDTTFMATFTGNIWSSPLYYEKGPGGKGIFIAVTYGNDVFALDETTGATVWTKKVDPPATGSIGCAGIAGPTPLGILSTPVIDDKTGTIYVAYATGGASGITANKLTALDIMTGEVKAGWPVDVSGKLMFDPKIHIQRSALSLVNGIVYVAYGGFVGDCGDYRGRVVAVRANDPTAIAGWATGGRGEGIWPAGGMASDGTSVFAATGNTTGGGAARTNSESIVRITGMAAFDKANTKDFFYPSNFAAMDSNDADMSSSSPVYFTVPGATPANLIAAFSKDGHMFLLDSTNLGGMGKQLSDTMLSEGTMSLYATPTVYTTATGVRLAMSPKGGSACPSGSSGSGASAVMAVGISATSPPKATPLWCASVGGTAGQPISTTTDGKSDPIVWIMNGTKLNGFDGETGASITTGGSGSCSGVMRWTSPIAVKGRIIAGGNGHLCAWSVQ